MKIFPIFFLVLCSYVGSAQLVVDTFPRVPDLKNWDNFSGVHSIRSGADSVVANWQNGMLNGIYTSYYPNGHVKASGQFKNNFRTGKWTLYSEDGKGKVLLNFNQFGYVTLHRARIPGKGGVRFGRGTINYAIPDFAVQYGNDSTGGLITGNVRFRHGLKNGRLQEYYSNGKLRSESTFSNGLYDGKRFVNHANGALQYSCEFENGTPIGERKVFAPDGSLMSSRNMQAYLSSNNSFYLDEFDVFMSSRKLLYTDTSFEKTNLFFAPDSAKPLFEVLNNAFVEGKLSAYNDDEMREMYFPFHDKPDISALTEDEGDWNNLRGLQVKVDEVFNTQTWLMYKFPIAIRPVSSFQKVDSTVFCGGPWLYFPQLRNDIPAKDYHFSYFKSFGYPFITISAISIRPWVIDYTNVKKIAAEQLRSTESEHNVWLAFYGLRKDGKVF